MVEQPTQYEPSQTAEHASTSATLGQANAYTAQAQAGQYQIEEQERSLAEAQLECEETLQKIYHLLKQDVLRQDPNTKLFDWKGLKDPTQRVLTDLGVDKIMQVMQSYINKETLLSNFSTEQINQRMKTFCKAFNANIFLKYEIYFRTPSFEECKVILKDRLKDKVNLRLLANEIGGITSDKASIEREIMLQVEDRIEYEMQKIKQEQVKINLREYELLVTQLQHLVEATHNRAWKGEERGSLRRHLNISEVIGQSKQQKQGGMLPWPRK